MVAPSARLGAAGSIGQRAPPQRARRNDPLTARARARVTMRASPTCHPPGLSNFLRLSFRQTLLAAFLLIAGLLAAASLGGLFTLERVMAQSRVATASALLLTADARQLAELRVAMERSARQYIVLDDPSLLRGFTQASDDATRLLGEMRRHDLPRALSHAMARAGAADQGRSWTAPRPRSSSARTRSTRAFAPSTASTTRSPTPCAAAARSATRRCRRSWRPAARRWARQVLGAIVLAALLALAFGVWLTRPLKRLERAIAGLGENRMDHPVDIRGPSDMRSLGRRLEWLRLRLKELDEDKARFLRYTSHELKTPLAALREGVALLEDGVAGPMTADQREIARILGHNTATLQSQIEALLRFNAAAFEARRLNRSDTDLRDLLHRARRGAAAAVAGAPAHDRSSRARRRAWRSTRTSCRRRSAICCPIRYASAPSAAPCPSRCPSQRGVVRIDLQRPGPRRRAGRPRAHLRALLPRRGASPRTPCAAPASGCPSCASTSRRTAAASTC